MVPPIFLVYCVVSYNTSSHDSIHIPLDHHELLHTIIDMCGLRYGSIIIFQLWTQQLVKRNSPFCLVTSPFCIYIYIFHIVYIILPGFSMFFAHVFPWFFPQLGELHGPPPGHQQRQASKQGGHRGHHRLRQARSAAGGVKNRWKKWGKKWNRGMEIEYDWIFVSPSQIHWLVMINHDFLFMINHPHPYKNWGFRILFYIWIIDSNSLIVDDSKKMDDSNISIGMITDYWMIPIVCLLKSIYVWIIKIEKNENEIMVHHHPNWLKNIGNFIIPTDLFVVFCFFSSQLRILETLETN